MSQHMFNTCRLLEDEKREEIISVTMGWDKLLQYFNKCLMKCWPIKKLMQVIN